MHRCIDSYKKIHTSLYTAAKDELHRCVDFYKKYYYSNLYWVKCETEISNNDHN